MIKLTKMSNNLHKVVIDDLIVYFSYETAVAFYYKELFISKNIWSVTTGKHLNMISPDKSIRIDHATVLDKLKNVLG